MPMTIFMDDRVLRALDKDLQDVAFEFAKQGGMKQPLTKIAHTVLAPSIDENFINSGRPTKWEQVGTSHYRKKYNDDYGPPLWVTGKLKRAASAKARFKVADNKINYGYFPSGLWFAHHLDKGYDGPSGFPARPFALIQAPDIKASIDILAEWVEDMVNKHVKRVYI